MRKIRISIIGAGRMGITHYSIINSHPNVEIESVADPSNLLLTMIKKYLPVKTFKDYEELFNQTKPDAILVCTPPALHYPTVKKAAALGIHAFVEKPFTTKFKEASELAELYARNDLIGQVGYVNRVNDVFIKVKELLTQNVIGTVVNYRSEMFVPTVVKKNEETGWRASRESGGGAIFEIASHLIDLTNYFFSSPDKITGTSLNQIYSQKVEDIVSATFLYSNKITGTIYVNWSDESYRKAAINFEIFGDGGKIQADQHGFKVYLKKENKDMNLIKGWNTFYFTDVYNPVPFYVRGNDFTRQLYNFADFILEGKKNTLCNFSDGAATLKVIESMLDDYNKNGKI